MLSEDSDIAEDSPSEEKKLNHQIKRKEQALDASAYRLRNVLRPGRTTQYTVKTLVDQIHEGDIDLNPEYQRDVVWSDIKQIGLIDSIFRNFYVPPIIFAVTTEEDGTEKRVCIDGKQRLTSMEKFIGGIIPYRDPFTKEKLWFVDNGHGPKRSLLPSQYKNLFLNKQMVCIEYGDLSPDVEREVFQRVQMGMALTTAEKFRAISGPWPDLIQNILKQYYANEDGISTHINLEKNRASDYQTIAHTIFCIAHLPTLTQGTTMQIERWLADQEGPSLAMQANINSVFRTYRDLAKDDQLNIPFKRPSRVAPIEFVMAGVLIALHQDTHTLPQLSQFIGILRTETRSTHIDIRANAKVFKTMCNIVSTKATVSGKTSAKRKWADSNDGEKENASDEKGKPKVAKTVPSLPGTPQTDSTTAAPSTATPGDQVSAKSPGLTAASPSAQSTSRSTPTRPRGIARIHAAKAYAADIISSSPANPAPSNPAASATDQSHQLHTLPSPPPPGQRPRKIDTSLEAVLMSSRTQSGPPSYTHLPRSTPTEPAALRRSQRSTERLTAISANVGYRTSPTGPSTENSHREHETMPASGKMETSENATGALNERR